MSNLSPVLGKFTLVPSSKQERGYTTVATVINEQGKEYFAKWIKGASNGSEAISTFKDKLRHIKRAKHPSLPSIVAEGFDESLNSFCIIYDKLIDVDSLENKVNDLDPEAFLSGLIELVDCLSELSVNHKIFHGDIHPANILLNEAADKFYLIDFNQAVITAAISQEKNLQVFAARFAAPERFNRDAIAPSLYLSDIYSIGKVVDWYFNEHDYPSNSKIEEFIQHSTQIDPTKRYLRHNDLKQVLMNIRETYSPEENGYYATVEIKRAFSHLLNQALGELNGNEVAYDVLTNEGDNIALNIIAGDHFFNVIWLIEKKHFVILDLCSREDERWKRAKGEAKKYRIADLKFTSNTSESRRTQYPFTNLFRKFQQEKKSAKSWRESKRAQTDELEFYKELLKKELELINDRSLKLRYKRFEKKSSDELWLYIVASEKGSKDSEISKHLDLSNDPQFEGKTYVITESGTNAKKKNQLKFSGIAYDFIERERVLKFKDCSNVSFDNFPKDGFLWEDMGMQEEEKKRQQQAISKVEGRQTQNDELIHYLFNPSKLPQAPALTTELPIVFQKDSDGVLFKYSYNQRKAINLALERKPLSLIQGPPGTGKTTVITEIVFQMLHRDPYTKILITSQTNDAVDNVLENLINQQIEVVRLAGEIKPRNKNIAKHTIDRKVEGWKNEIAKRSNNYWQGLERVFSADIKREEKAIQEMIGVLNMPKKWDAKKEIVNRIIAENDTYKGLRSHFDSEEDFGNALAQKCNHVSLKRQKTLSDLHNQWIAAIQSVSETSVINEKLIDEIKVVGATCNHVASKKYSRFNFEFDYVIMDESAKATTAESLVPIVFAENLVLVGDHRQLKPMVTKDKEIESWLRGKFKIERTDEDDQFDDYINRPSLFEKVYESLRSAEDYTTQLVECRRCSEDQVRLLSQCFYEPFGDNEIIYVPRAEEKEHNLDLKIDSTIIFLDIGAQKKSQTNEKGSSYNTFSADLIMEVLKSLDTYGKVSNYTVGVITGYTAQAKQLKSKLNGLRSRHKFKNVNPSSEKFVMSVVDRFQGLEKDIIIFDLVKSGANTRLGFLKVANRINVAVSRQKRLLILVGDYTNIKNAPVKGKDKIQLQEYLKKLNSNWIVKSIQEIF